MLGNVIIVSHCIIVIQIFSNEFLLVNLISKYIRKCVLRLFYLVHNAIMIFFKF